MQRYVHYQYRVVRKHGVEIVFGQWMVSRKLVLVIAIANEQLSRCQPALVGDAASLPAQRSAEECFRSCRRWLGAGYAGCAFTEGAPEDYNCRLYSAITGAYASPASGALLLG